jgi:cell division septation protein DedD
VKKEYLVPFWVRRPKENQEKKKKKKIRENRVVQISAFRAEKKASAICSVLQKVCSSM